MRFEINRIDLLKVLSITKYVNVRTPQPILTHIHMTVQQDENGGKLIILASDTDMTYQKTLPLLADTTHIDGSATISAVKFYEEVKSMVDSETIEVWRDDDKVIVKGLKTTAKFVSLDPSEYPEILGPNGFNQYDFKVNPMEMANYMGRVAFAASSLKTGHFMECVRVEMKPGLMKFLATDGHKCSVALLSTGDEQTVTGEFAVPVKRLPEFCKIISGMDREHTIIGSDEKIFFARDPETYVSIRIYSSDIKYPNMDRFLEIKPEISVLFDRKELLNSIEQLAVFSDDKLKKIVTELNGDNLMMSANHPNMGEVKSEIDTMEGEGQWIAAFNSDYLLDVVKALSSDNIYIEFEANNRPVRIKPEGINTYYTIVMPMRA